MPHLNPRQRHARNFNRRLDGSFWQLRLNHELSVRTNENEVRAMGEVYLKNEHKEDFLGRTKHAEAEVWVGYRELTWEPSRNIPWRIRLPFERESVNFVWVYQSTRGR
ncbi:hypothetical protein F441_13073 [Phytophthora nicotianae CJ01A1]|uniref:Uncharacterized protein n=3 Tax=Phytophthora nicotianae TaxID=4792 RepID=W2WMM7_PHYNI|nr:hypothetical protein L917_12567 [Phytophthora nicotianae]ETO70294.1 hypothetical protein F444_13207 [Phytophthora nicotianae P1976]ETP11403.1 hypothetical protein F441_13073 [Phytophthora nicotianae CJ01A1]